MSQNTVTTAHTTLSGYCRVPGGANPFNTDPAWYQTELMTSYD